MRVQIITTERNAQLTTILTGVMIATGNHLDVTDTEKIPENVRTLRTGISLENVQVTGTVLEGVSRAHTTPAGTGPDNTERKIPQDRDTGADETRLPDVTTMRKESVCQKCRGCGGKSCPDRKKCPAFNTRCSNCTKFHHFRSVCTKPKAQTNHYHRKTPSSRQNTNTKR